jgi:hypothetical protein
MEPSLIHAITWSMDPLLSHGMKCVETPFARTVSITSFASLNKAIL